MPRCRRRSRKFGFDVAGGINNTLELEDVGSTGTSISGEPIAPSL
jgi:hypothetical protein